MLSLSYVTLAGYVKTRDWVVANCRSQLVGAFESSDYYSSRNDGFEGPLGGDGYWQYDGTPKWDGKAVTNPSQCAVGISHR